MYVSYHDYFSTAISSFEDSDVSIDNIKYNIETNTWVKWPEYTSCNLSSPSQSPQRTQKRHLPPTEPSKPADSNELSDRESNSPEDSQLKSVLSKAKSVADSKRAEPLTQMAETPEVVEEEEVEEMTHTQKDVDTRGEFIESTPSCRFQWLMTKLLKVVIRDRSAKQV